MKYDNELIYRIVSLEGFLSLLINKQERFVRPIDCWEDTFEGYMLHLLDTDNGVHQVIDELYREISDENWDVTIRNFSKLQRSRYGCYGLCWSKLRDSDALWRIYSYERKGIQLISSRYRIASMLDSSGWDVKNFDILDVNYDIENEEEAVKKILRKNSKVNSAYFHKRPAFEHEKEVRVILNDVDKYKNIEAFFAQAIKVNVVKTDKNKPMIDRVQEAICTFGGKENYLKIAPESLFVAIDNIAEYITGVRVHPLAADWYVELIKNLCKKYRLVFYGKSDLYRMQK